MKCRTGSKNVPTAYPEGMQLLAEEVANEPIPENLLELAQELQRVIEAKLKDRNGQGG